MVRHGKDALTKWCEFVCQNNPLICSLLPISCCCHPSAGSALRRATSLSPRTRHLEASRGISRHLCFRHLPWHHCVGSLHCQRMLIDLDPFVSPGEMSGETTNEGNEWGKHLILTFHLDFISDFHLRLSSDFICHCVSGFSSCFPEKLAALCRKAKWKQPPWLCMFQFKTRFTSQRSYMKLRSSRFHVDLRPPKSFLAWHFLTSPSNRGFKRAAHLPSWNIGGKSADLLSSWLPKTALKHISLQTSFPVWKT